jgi:hypothetical protein
MLLVAILQHLALQLVTGGGVQQQRGACRSAVPCDAGGHLAGAQHEPHFRLVLLMYCRQQQLQLVQGDARLLLLLL